MYKVGITGSAAGIGKGIAFQFVKKGYSVALIDRFSIYINYIYS